MIIEPSPELEEIRPKLIPSLLAGLEAMANHVWLILLPVVLDIALWLAPHLGVQKILGPIFEEVAKMITDYPMPASISKVDLSSATDIYRQVITSLNLLASLRSFPIGIPSLMADKRPVSTPFGMPLSIQVSDFPNAFLMIVVFGLIGLILSSIYYCQICRITTKKEVQPPTPGLFGWLTLQLLTLTGLVLVVALFFGLPAMMIFSSIFYLNPMMASALVIFGSLAAVWLLFPLVFSAHGIFTNHLPVLRSIAASIQVVRLTLPTTSTFILICLVISQGLNRLWILPLENSWLLLVGILGHAFISSSLIAASFYYYRDALHFFQTILAKSQMAQQPSSPEIIK